MTKIGGDNISSYNGFGETNKLSKDDDTVTSSTPPKTPKRNKEKESFEISHKFLYLLIF